VTQLVAGQRAVVTGGSTGLGFATAKRLLEHGAHVLIAGRRTDVLDSAAAKLKEFVAGGSIATHACDVTGWPARSPPSLPGTSSGSTVVWASTWARTSRAWSE
jgi:NAD(P)-dependent dehydrogenase (short-subunit alcohol dehydrogenase family)